MALDIGALLNGQTPSGLEPSQPGQPMVSMGAPSRNLAAEWSNWINQPGNRQALVQAGIQLLQPLGVGQTPLGQIGQAIGGGMQAKDRVTKGQAEQRLAERRVAVEEREATNRTEQNRLSMSALLANQRALAGSFEDFVQAWVEEVAKQEESADLTGLKRADRNAIRQRIMSDQAQLAQLRQLWESSRGGGGAPAPSLGTAIPAQGPGGALPPAPDGTVRRNDQTGKMEKKVNGQWVPI